MQNKNTAKSQQITLKKHYKTPNIQTNFDVHYLDYNHRKKLQSNIETFTMPSTREKEKKYNNGWDISVTCKLS